VPFDTVLFEETLAAKILEIILHARAVTAVAQSGEVVHWNDTKCADFDESLNFGLAERVLVVAVAVGGAKTVGVVLSEAARSAIRTLDRVASARTASYFLPVGVCRLPRRGTP